MTGRRSLGRGTTDYRDAFAEYARRRRIAFLSGLAVSGRPAGKVDAALLPGSLVALIDRRLGPGEDLLITRNGEPAASISSTLGAFDAGTVYPYGQDGATAESSSTGETRPLWPPR